MKTCIKILILTILLSSCSFQGSSKELYSGSPEALICQEEDLPGIYFLIDDLSGPRPNSELVINVDEPAATDQFIELTGRLSGWEHRFMLGEPTQTLPGFILCQVVVFESSEGANQAMGWPTEEPAVILESERQIGDEMILKQISFDAPDGSPWIDYRLEFSYNNLLGVVSSYTPENLAEPDYVLDLAEILYQRFQEPISK